MADFVPKSAVKSAVRTLTTPFETKAAMNTVIGSILTDNPWECTSYTSGGASLPAVAKSTEAYSGKVIYENTEGKQIGTVTIKAPTSSGFDTCMSNTLANTALETAMGDVASHDRSDDSFSVTLKFVTEKMSCST